MRRIQRLALVLILVFVNQVLPLSLTGGQGKVSVFSGDSLKVVSAADFPKELIPGECVVTNDTGVAYVRASGKVALRLGGATRMSVLNSKAVSLDSGTAFAVIQSGTGQQFSIITPEVVVGVRGTKFATRVARGKMASFAVVEGAIDLKDPQGNLVMVLPQGKKVKKPFGKPFGVPTALSPTELQSLEKMEPPAETPVMPEVAPDSEAVSATTPVAPDSGKVAKVPAIQDTAEAKSDSSQTVQELPVAEPDSTQDKVPAETAQTSAPVAVDQAVPASEEPVAEPPAKEGDEDKAEEKPKDKEGIGWEIGLGTMTIDGKQWQRINISPDIPIWKFGVCFDIEFFIDDSGNFSDKGWQFGGATEALESISRKIRYVRFAKSGDPLHVKLGAIEGVSLGYGMVMSGFGNTFEYPEYKKLGLQFELNGLTGLGFGLQTVIQDLQAIEKGATVAGARLSVAPLSSTGVPLLSKLQVGVCAAGDENQYKGLRDTDNDGVPDQADDYPRDAIRVVDPGNIELGTKTLSQITTEVQALWQTAANEENRRKRAFGQIDRFVVWGADVGMPIVQTGLVSVVLYGQYARNLDYADKDDSDTTSGWGIAAPGLLLKAGPFNGNVEFRHLQNRFRASYFNGSYEQERLIVVANTPLTKEATLDSVAVNGVFASVGAKLGPVASVNASYEHLVGSVAGVDGEAEKSLSAGASLGKMIAEKIPKLNSARAYWRKTNIGRATLYNTSGDSTGSDEFFGESPYVTYGYCVEFEIAKGIGLIWEKRYTYQYDEEHQLVPEPRIYIQTAIRF